jgi:hypothetical protein
MSLINAACSPSEGNSQVSKKSPKIPKLKPNAVNFNFNPKQVDELGITDQAL